MDWGTGYPIDVPYTTSFYGEHAPSHLASVMLLAGVRPPDIDGPFALLELGCGTGLSLLALAAANPDAHFVGVDFNPSDIAVGRALVAETGITNVSLIEADFRELTTDDLVAAPFDFAICHGVYTWVAPEVQLAIVDVLKQHLKVGAALMIGYNSLPGWAGAMGLQRLLADTANFIGGSSDDKMLAALKIAFQMADAGFGGVDLAFLPPSVHEVKTVGSAAELKMDPAVLRYLAHEFLSAHWRPMFREELAADLARAKLEFVASTERLDQFPETLGSPSQRAIYDQLPGPYISQAVELAHPPRFRKDIFMRGRPPLGSGERQRRIADEELALSVPREMMNFKVNAHIGEATLPEKRYAPLVDALAERPCRVGELMRRSAELGDEISAEEIYAMLLSTGNVFRLRQSSVRPVSAMIRRVNRVIARYAQSCATAHTLALAAGNLGTAIPVDRSACAMYEVLTMEDLMTPDGALTGDDEGITDRLKAVMADRGVAFRSADGRPADAETTGRMAREAVRTARMTLWPEWQRLGMV